MNQEEGKRPRNLKKAVMILSSGDPEMYDGAMFSYKGDFLEYLGLEDMGVFTAYGMENGSAAKLEEIREFGRTLNSGRGGCDMRKIFSLAVMFLLTFALAACRQETATGGSTETNQAADIVTVPATNSAKSIEDFGVSEQERSEPSAEETNIMKTEFNFETRTVTLNSGYEMPVNGLGTYSLHGEECINSVRTALESGVRLIDTASAYGNEVEIGQAIRDAIGDGLMEREELFVITKIYPGDEMENPDASIQACLDRLDIGYVDMMLLHHPDSNDVQAYKAMEQFVKDGKIRSIGLSNWYVEELAEFLPQVDIAPALVQNEIHPYYQENDVIPFIQEKGIVVQGWYPLGGRGHTAELLGDSVISKIAEAHGVSSAQVILRWNLQKGVVVIPGSSNPDHIKENTELYHFELTAEEMERINALDRGEKHDWY